VPAPGPLTTLVVGNALALALASTALAYLLYFRLIAAIGPARALTVTFLIPVFGVLWGLMFLSEPVTPDTVSGCVLILAGTWIALRGAPQAARPASGARIDRPAVGAAPPLALGRSHDTAGGEPACARATPLASPRGQTSSAAGPST